MAGQQHEKMVRGPFDEQSNFWNSGAVHARIPFCVHVALAARWTKVDLVVCLMLATPKRPRPGCQVVGSSMHKSCFMMMMMMMTSTLARPTSKMSRHRPVPPLPRSP